MRIVFTDLDGTLLDPLSYSFEAAKPALEALRKQHVPLIFSTSKTRAEVELWRMRLGNAEPFIVENGGAIYIPKDYFRSRPAGSVLRAGYHVIEFGTPYRELVSTLKDASQESGCLSLGFSDMSLADLCLRSRLPVNQAVLAKEREYDEPFEIVDGGAYRLLEAIESRGKRWTRGDRFYHITGHNDKVTAVGALLDFYRGEYGKVTTAGLGDGWNDAQFLATMDVSVLVRSRFDVALKKAIPRSIVTEAPGPHGWNSAVLQLLAA
jgi:mannosyl-3-phosphoglycerate phosphatase